MENDLSGHCSTENLLKNDPLRFWRTRWKVTPKGVNIEQGTSMGVNFQRWNLTPYTMIYFDYRDL